ncbi:nucleoside-diphosphate kinase [Clostridium akagii]|uniref:nucleoside-diphosphate kinase n=1 Tax=Clostridium akagii TaxID=91623 RepID=UPI00047C81AC|nr:nucleoside-diphosphate kinase [Clostridium akagii]
MEKTLVLIKPDGVQRGLIGSIISFYEKKSLYIIALKMLRADKTIAQMHYNEHEGKEYFGDLIDYITEGRICAMIVGGEDAIEIVRKINGDKNPKLAEMGSIRGIYADDRTRNLVHASDNEENAKREIELWFPEIKL